MSEDLILAIDQGTTNSKVSIFDSAGTLIREASRPVGIHFPQPGWVEQDPAELWQTVLAAAKDALHGLDAGRLCAVGLANQRESALLWDRRTGQALGPCVSWQCKRSAPLVDELRAQGLEETVRAKTGLTLDPMFSAGKARWLLDQVPDGQARAAAGELCLGTVDAWLLWNLSAGQVHACDMTNASRTQLFNLHTLDWDAELLEMFGLPRAMLPQVRLSSEIFGELKPNGLLPGGLPIAAMIGDSHAALFGHAGFQPGALKATYGTGSSLMMPTARPVFSRQGLSTSLAWGYREAAYALEGNIYVTGAAVQWLAELLGLSGPGEVEALAVRAETSRGVYFVPALAGLGAPYWKGDARGLVSGLTRGAGRAELARATLESIAYQVRDVFEVMQAEAGAPLQVLMGDGGPTRNQTLMQFQADILGVPVLASRVSDVSALGAAYLAGLAVGLWRSLDEVAALERPHARYEPRMDAARREALYAGWKEAVERVMAR